MLFRKAAVRTSNVCSSR
ncbi:Protein of unknown function [Pyronema omphalodes CBS 100304]|uniref:Uncharacterized protein n=1 Tax=Pyronema omphalodes (strain CBS 100304) TaxID=1076935 RepID=U4LFL7_PYROM|nr:Protein of unknown function [Pyronema omphalodes CBS 100304]